VRFAAAGREGAEEAAEAVKAPDQAGCMANSKLLKIDAAGPAHRRVELPALLVRVVADHDE